MLDHGLVGAGGVVAARLWGGRCHQQNRPDSRVTFERYYDELRPMHAAAYKAGTKSRSAMDQSALARVRCRCPWMWLCSFGM